ncbi:carbohydrate ABC transporter permease [Demequina aestuarii]|uniref:carbohydrate ABC transporter permease n=1 Tax=Demequina aestuarii TaxID=327095 RepID=UPI000785D5A4|nr:carbohydrate ABC transporter permease [Demequina aestuarii]
MSATTDASTPEAAASEPPRRMRRKRSDSWLHAALIPIALLWMLPVIMVIGLSLMPANDPSTTFFGMLPESPSLSNYTLVWEQNPILQHLVNSLLITVPSVIIVAMAGSMAAFALARLHVPVKALVFGLLILGLVLPMSGIVVAAFKILQAIGLYNSILGVVLVYSALGMPFAVIILRTGYLAIPDETYEAARMDGASTWAIFWKIYFPLGRPALSVVVIWQVMMSWNDFLLPLVALGDNDLKPLTLVPLAYRGVFLSQPGALFAVLVLISIPVILVFIAVQRYLVNGLAGAVK